MAGDRRREGLRGTADGEWGDAHDGVAGLDLLTEFHQDLHDTTSEGCADGAVFFRWNNEDGGNLDRGGEIDDGSFGGFEAEVFALGFGEGDRTGESGGAHFRPVVMAWASVESHGQKKAAYGCGEDQETEVFPETGGMEVGGLDGSGRVAHGFFSVELER
jgi:hypothetical protein